MNSIRQAIGRGVLVIDRGSGSRIGSPEKNCFHAFVSNPRLPAACSIAYNGTLTHGSCDDCCGISCASSYLIHVQSGDSRNFKPVLMTGSPDKLVSVSCSSQILNSFEVLTSSLTKNEQSTVAGCRFLHTQIISMMLRGTMIVCFRDFRKFTNQAIQRSY